MFVLRATQNINTMWGHNIESLNVQLVLNIVTIGL